MSNGRSCLSFTRPARFSFVHWCDGALAVAHCYEIMNEQLRAWLAINDSCRQFGTGQSAVGEFCSPVRSHFEAEGWIHFMTPVLTVVLKIVDVLSVLRYSASCRLTIQNRTVYRSYMFHWCTSSKFYRWPCTAD